MRLKRLAHVLLRVADVERSRAFYQDVLGFQVVEEDPEHGGVFLSLGEDFHNLDLAPHPSPGSAQHPKPDQVGVAHIAFQVDGYPALRDAYVALQDHGVEILTATDHVSQRSIYFHDPDGNRLEIYYEVPNALELFGGNRRGDLDVPLAIKRPGEPLPDWLLEEWPRERRHDLVGEQVQ